MNFFDADRLTSKDRAEIYFLFAETDATAMGNHDRSVVEGVVDVWQALVGTRRSLIDIRRTLHAESFVRSFVVKDVDEFVEARLLLKEICGSWFGSFFLQSEMHAFMTAVLLGMARLDPFDADAQP